MRQATRGVTLRCMALCLHAAVECKSSRALLALRLVEKGSLLPRCINAALNEWVQHLMLTHDFARSMSGPPSKTFARRGLGRGCDKNRTAPGVTSFQVPIIRQNSIASMSVAHRGLKSYLCQRLIEVCDKIVGILDTDRYADQIVGNAEQSLARVRH